MPPSPETVPDWLNVFFNLGTGALVIWWFMFRLSPAITDLAREVGRLGRILITLTLTVAQKLAHCDAIEEQCAEYKRELDEADALRDKK